MILKALNKKDQEVEMEADYCLVAVGRKPHTEGLNLEKAGLKVNERGQIEINENMQTSVSNIRNRDVKRSYAGSGSRRGGVYVAEFLAGQKPHINHNLILEFHTWPEVSCCKTEQELKTEISNTNQVFFRLGFRT